MLIIAVAASISSCGRTGSSASGGGTIEVVDTLGRTVKIKGPVTRVYYGFYYENLLAAAGPEVFTKVVATSLYDTEGYFLTLSKLYREHVAGYADMIDIGSTFNDDFNIEKLLELDLDVVIMGEYQYTALGDRVSVLENAGIPVVMINYTVGSIEMQCRSTEILGQIFGTEERAKKINDEYKAAYAEIERRTAGITDKKTAFAEFHSTVTTYKEIGSSGASGFMANYLNRAGAVNLMEVFSRQSDMQRIDPEYLLEADPDFIFIVGGESVNKNKDGALMGHNVTAEQVSESLEGMVTSRPGWSELTAVRSHNTYLIENGVCRTMQDYVLVQYMAKCMYPELFDDTDPLQNMKDYYAEYLPMLPFEGTFFYQYKYQ